MLRVFWTSKTAMLANAEKLDVIANNINNVNTIGYKKADASFKDLMNESLVRNGYPTSTDATKNKTLYTGTGVKLSGITRNNKQGELKQTNVLSDLAIDGQGNFQVSLPDGSKAYTRAGAFNINSKGNLADSNGNLLTINYENGYNSDNVKITQNNFGVQENGDLFINNGGTLTKVGNIPLYDTNGSDGFISTGENLLLPAADAQLYTVSDASIIQGFQENSNVDISTEMTDMIITQRAYELASKGIQTADSMWGMINNLRGK